MKRNSNVQSKNLKWLFQNDFYYRNQLLNLLNDETQDNTLETLLDLLIETDKEKCFEQLAMIYHKIYVIQNQMLVLDRLSVFLDVEKNQAEKIITRYDQYLTLYTTSIDKNQLLFSLSKTNEEAACLLLQSISKISFKDFYKNQAQAPYLYQILDALQLHNTAFFNKEIALIQDKQIQLEQLLKSRILNTILHKAERQLHTCLKSTNNQQQLLDLKKKTIQKLNAASKEAFNDPKVSQFIAKIDEIINHQPLMLPAIIYFNYVPSEEAIKNDDHRDIAIVIEFYNAHHLYLKLKKITQELTLHPHLIDYFKQYQIASRISDKNERINQLDMLIEDINVQSPIKKLECISKLLSMTKKEVNQLINEESPEPATIKIVPKTTISPQSEKKMTIGGFSLDANSVRANPDTLENLMPLITLECEEQKQTLERLMNEIGFDKLKAYIQKQPYLKASHLHWIIKTDRLLRYQYQDLLEGVELYFRSSFTQYLSNKYDEIYDVIGIKDKHFYYRGYLRNYVFEDNDLHYENIKKLNNRIDNEMAANNTQVIEEFKECKYAISFSTAAGLMTFGWLIGIFQNLVFCEKKAFLSAYFNDLTPQSFNAWITSLNNLRNKCAHYQSLYRLSSMKELRPIMTKPEDQRSLDQFFSHHSFFYYTLIAVRLSPNKENVSEFIDSIERLFNKAQQGNQSFNLELDYSFPDNWQYYLNLEKGICTIK